jgi:hypothetical protein
MGFSAKQLQALRRNIDHRYIRAQWPRAFIHRVVSRIFRTFDQATAPVSENCCA